MSSSHQRLTITALHTTLSFFPTPLVAGNRSDDHGQDTTPNRTCTLVFNATRHRVGGARGGRPHRRLQVDFLGQTCTRGNSVLVVEKKPYNAEPGSAFEWNRLSWTGCEPDYDPLPEYVAREPELTVVLRVADARAEYGVRMVVRFDHHAPPQSVSLEVRRVSASLGESFF